MAKSVRPEDLAKTIGRELTIYAEDVQKKVDAVGRKAVKKLVRVTQETAPLGKRRGENYATSISSMEIKDKHKRGSTFVWYVKPPNHRLTHLLVHGHPTPNGGWAESDPFLENALDEVLPEYEKEVEEAVKG